MDLFMDTRAYVFYPLGDAGFADGLTFVVAPEKLQ